MYKLVTNVSSAEVLSLGGTNADDFSTAHFVFTDSNPVPAEWQRASFRYTPNANTGFIQIYASNGD